MRHIRLSEGLMTEAYLDSAGVWTIGYGHTKGVRRGDRISAATAEGYLQQDLAPVERFVAALPQVVTQGQFDALCDFAFNLGLGALKGSTLLRHVKAGRPDADIQAEFRRWVYCKGRVLDGLVKRREWEARRWKE